MSFLPLSASVEGLSAIVGGLSAIVGSLSAISLLYQRVLEVYQRFRHFISDCWRFISDFATLSAIALFYSAIHQKLDIDFSRFSDMKFINFVLKIY
ncbi:hypothetical protein [Lysinibacillus sp. fls2-241-R2A-57]|uniref:hypothetical protein n=1 Tax=Lysinibacillus sp. fls2-241-R2A-57 TaxID=3040292 RepID=UPI00255574DA|nr:hypothetical protein [Lysinibacillus sp. fls2-241-R2A-57]